MAVALATLNQQMSQSYIVKQQLPPMLEIEMHLVASKVMVCNLVLAFFGSDNVFSFVTYTVGNVAAHGVVATVVAVIVKAVVAAVVVNSFCGLCRLHRLAPFHLFPSPRGP